MLFRGVLYQNSNIIFLISKSRNKSMAVLGPGVLPSIRESTVASVMLFG